MRANTAPRQRSKATTSRSPLIRAIIVTLVVLTQGLICGGEGETPVRQDPKSQATQTESKSQSSLVPQARQHPSYQVFAHQSALPSITVVDQATLEVGDNVKIDVSRPDQLPDQQKEALADQFEVPVGVINKLFVRFSNPPPTDAAHAAQELRTTVIDYKYLQERLNKYHPPSGGEAVKTNALQALQVGDIDKAWEMYIAIPKPSAPTKLRIVR